MTDAPTLQQIVYLLTIINIITPIIFAWLAYKLGTIFATKTELTSLKEYAKSIHEDHEELNGHVITLLQRTAHLRVESERK